MSLDDLAKYLGITRSELTDNFRTDTMYRIAQGLDLPEDIGKIVRNPREFNASTLERLVQSTKAMDYLGVTFDEQGNASGKIHPEEFKKAYTRMVTDIAQGTIHTRTLNTSKHIRILFAGLGQMRRTANERVLSHRILSLGWENRKRVLPHGPEALVGLLDVGSRHTSFHLR